MDILFIIVSFIVLITIIVGIHELGHFLTARFFKIHVLKFKIGFGKEIFSFQDKHNCSYSFGVLPLGGYVQMLGESNPVQEDSSPNFSDKKSYLDASPGERAAVTVAGPLANFILAGFVYSYLALVGTTQLSSYIGDVVPGSLVEEAGLISGDRIIEVDQDRIDIFNDINLTLSKRIGDTGAINIKFLREGIERNTVVSISEWLEDDEQKSPSAALGMLPFMPPLVGQLQEDGPAYKYGLMQGDLIQAVNNEKIVTWQDLSKNLNALPDQLIELMVLREGE